MRAYADPDEAVNWDKVSAELAAIPGMNEFPAIIDTAKQEVVAEIESLLAGGECQGDCAFGDLGPELNLLFASVFGRSRTAGEFGFSISSDFPLAMTVTSTSKFNEEISFAKVADVEAWDLTDPSMVQQLVGNEYELLAETFATMERVVITATGTHGSRLVDALLLGHKPESGVGSLIIPISSVASDSGQMPPSLMVGLNWRRWGCAVSGLIFAGTLTACFGGIGGCASGCIFCCTVGIWGCCGAFSAGVNTWRRCVGATPPAVDFAEDIVTVGCLLLGRPRPNP